MAIKQRAADKPTKEEKINALKLEIDYHLMGLFDAMQANDAKESRREKTILLRKTRQLSKLPK